MAVRVLLAVLLVAQGFAQKQPPPAPPSSQEPKPIRVQVNEVIVPVTVTDEKGRFVSDLDQADFQSPDFRPRNKFDFDGNADLLL